MDIYYLGCIFFQKVELKSITIPNTQIDAINNDFFLLNNLNLNNSFFTYTPPAYATNKYLSFLKIIFLWYKSALPG